MCATLLNVIGVPFHIFHWHFVAAFVCIFTFSMVINNLHSWDWYADIWNINNKLKYIL